MAQFRKKPVVIDAVQYSRRFGWPDWFHDAVSRNDIVVHSTGKFASPEEPCYCEIKTLEGVMRADENDWIIRGVKGEIYPCKPDIFAATYEPVNPLRGLLETLPKSDAPRVEGSKNTIA